MPHLSTKFAQITDPKQRTAVPRIRNRRTKYTHTAPKELFFPIARNTWPHLWDGRERRGEEEGREERLWAEEGFMPGQRKHVNKIGGLLGGYEEEREAERVRTLRRERGAAASVAADPEPQPQPEDDFVPEEDSESDEDEDRQPEIPAPLQASLPELEETDAERQAYFERTINARFIYGLLDDIDYDNVDWDETLDDDEDREAEERWFDDDDDDDEA